MNPYKELDVDVNATVDQIKQRYRNLAHLHHPDKGGDAEIFKRIKEAYEILINPLRRRKFDLTGEYTEDTTVNSEALGMISQFLQQVIYGMDPYKDDLVVILRNKVQELRSNSHVNQMEAEKYIKHLEMIQNKTRKKAESDENILSSFISAQLELRLKEHKAFTRTMQVCDHATLILVDYHYIPQDLLT